MRLTTVATTFLVGLLAGTGVAAPRVSRDQPGGLGSAIALEYSVQHDVMRPGESVVLLLCLTNQNPESKRDAQQGDSFAFEFASGALGDCGSVSVISPGGELQASDFACEVQGQTLRLTRTGATMAWPPLDSACARVPFAVPANATRAATSMDVGNIGAFHAPSPAALLLNIGDDLGSIGPPGATGPTGPHGPDGSTGPAGTGASIMVVSTGVANARQNQPPEPVPGLDALITISAGSKLEVVVDAAGYECRFPELGLAPVYQLHLDGVIVAERAQGNDSSQYFNREELVVFAWLSDPLAAGSHRVRVLIDVDEDNPARNGLTRCVGSATDERRKCRLLVKELRSAP